MAPGKLESAGCQVSESDGVIRARTGADPIACSLAVAEVLEQLEVPPLSMNDLLVGKVERGSYYRAGGSIEEGGDIVVTIQSS